jgi:hypothetical protein
MFHSDPHTRDLDVARGLNARQPLETHWDTWVKDEDWEWLVERGINAVRIPVSVVLLVFNTPTDQFVHSHYRLDTIIYAEPIRLCSETLHSKILSMSSQPRRCMGEDYSCYRDCPPTWNWRPRFVSRFPSTFLSENVLLNI